MKSALIRILSIMTLATSISAFALPEKATAAKSTNANNAGCETTTGPYNPDKQKTDQDPGQSDNGQEKSRKQVQIEEQDKQWLHDLQGIYGG